VEEHKEQRPREFPGGETIGIAPAIFLGRRVVFHPTKEHGAFASRPKRTFSMSQSGVVSELVGRAGEIVLFQEAERDGEHRRTVC
jgi:hypothetical protein